MCHELVSAFADCPHKIQSSTIDCPRYDVNHAYCDPLDDPEVVSFPGVCPDCKNDSTKEAEEAMKMALAESAKAHEAWLQRPRQSDTDYEEQFRKAVEESADMYQPPPVPFAEQLKRATMESVALASDHASRPKLYFKQAYQYLGCGHTEDSGYLPIERSDDDPERIVEETGGLCSNCGGESSSAAHVHPALRPAASRPQEEDLESSLPPYTLEDSPKSSPGTSRPTQHHRSSSTYDEDELQDEIDEVMDAYGGPPAQEHPPDHASRYVNRPLPPPPMPPQSNQQPLPLQPAVSTPTVRPVNDGTSAHKAGKAVAVEEIESGSEDEGDEDDEGQQRYRPSASTLSLLMNHGKANQARFMGDPDHELQTLREEDDE